MHRTQTIMLFISENIIGTNIASERLPTSILDAKIYMQESSYTGEVVGFSGSWINIPGPKTKDTKSYPQNHWLVRKNRTTNEYKSYPYLMIPFFFDVVIK